MQLFAVFICIYKYKQVTANNMYLLFPISMITMLELECWRASSSHVVKWLNVSRLKQHITS